MFIMMVTHLPYQQTAAQETNLNNFSIILPQFFVVPFAYYFDYLKFHFAFQINSKFFFKFCRYIKI